MNTSPHSRPSVATRRQRGSSSRSKVPRNQPWPLRSSAQPWLRRNRATRATTTTPARTTPATSRPAASMRRTRFPATTTIPARRATLARLARATTACIRELLVRGRLSGAPVPPTDDDPARVRYRQLSVEGDVSHVLHRSGAPVSAQEPPRYELVWTSAITTAPAATQIRVLPIGSPL